MTAQGDMSVPTDTILDHLRALVAADSSDPVATMTPTHGAVTHCVRTLSAAGFEVSIDDLGDRQPGGSCSARPLTSTSFGTPTLTAAWIY